MRDCPSPSGGYTMGHVYRCDPSRPSFCADSFNRIFYLENHGSVENLVFFDMLHFSCLTNPAQKEGLDGSQL